MTKFSLKEDLVNLLNEVRCLSRKVTGNDSLADQILDLVTQHKLNADKLKAEAFERGARTLHWKLLFRAANNWHGLKDVDKSCQKENEVVSEWANEALDSILNPVDPHTFKPAFEEDAIVCTDQAKAALTLLHEIRYHRNRHTLERDWLTKADQVLGTFKPVNLYTVLSPVDRPGYVVLPVEPITGREYKMGLWSHRNWESILRDHEAAKHIPTNPEST